MAHASHIFGADLTYKYAGTPANPNQYQVTARLFREIGLVVYDPEITLTCGMDECGTGRPGSFTTILPRTKGISVLSSCTGTGNLSYEVVTLEGMIQLPPAHWTLIINIVNRARGIVNVGQSDMMSVYVKAVLDNTTPTGSSSLSLINTSPQFTNNQLIQLSNTQAQQRYSLGAFDSEGDSLVYQLIQPLANPTTTAPCGQATVGAVAPHFQLDAATGALLTVAGPAQLGRYALAARVDEYRQLNGKLAANRQHHARHYIFRSE